MVSVILHKPGLFLFLQITEDLSKITKNSEYPFVDIGH